MSAKTSPKHFYMVAAMVTYIRNETTQVTSDILSGDEQVVTKEAPKQRRVNIIMEMTRKAITESSINNARMAIFQRLAEESNISADEIKDFVFLGISHLGHMAPEDFYDMSGPKKTRTQH